ncbi:MAG: M20/M25/M40 family metallo-hydrolase [Adhaeribacter sp.]
MLSFPKRYFLLAAFSLAAYCCPAQTSPSDSVMVRRIFTQALTNGKSYENLRYLCTQIGPRLSGSAGAEKAVSWSKQVMEGMGLDRVILQQVQVPHWERGEQEQAHFKSSSGRQPVAVCALGGSVGTGKKGLTAQVVEVQDFEELQRLGREKVQGRIVFFNRPMNPAFILANEAYGAAVNQRSSGAVEAAKLGAVAAVVRSMNLAQDDFPHTGAMHYQDGVPQVPAVAISTKGADQLSGALKQDPDLKFSLKMNPRTFPDALSHNVVGEIKGNEFPEEIILVGGHLDSWDLAQGAHDDGAGCVQAIEVLRILKELNYKPRRTIRAVMFMNEENGLRGGLKYAELAKQNRETHLAAIESDAGGFTPRGFSLDAPAEKIRQIQRWQQVLAPYGLQELVPGGGGADINPLRNGKTALIGLRPDSQRYFVHHHAANDTFDQVNRRELELGGAAMAALVYLLDQYGLEKKQ